jgi:pyruvate kinase
VTPGEAGRRTKIVATVGPASADRGTLAAMSVAGMDVARVTLAHGTTDEIVWFAVQAAVRSGFAHSGDVVVVLAGSPIEPEPATDTLRLVRVH